MWSPIDRETKTFCFVKTIIGDAGIATYLLGLLAMIKCSICSYQCDNWYVSNWRLACHIDFSWELPHLGLLSVLHVLRWHCTLPGAAHPHYGGTSTENEKEFVMSSFVWLLRFECFRKERSTWREHRHTWDYVKSSGIETLLLLISLHVTTFFRTWPITVAHYCLSKTQQK